MALFRRGRTTQDEKKAGAAHDQPERSGLTPVSEWPDGAPPSAAPVVAPASTLFAGVCRYYHDCFAADARGGVLSNVLDKAQAEYLMFTEGQEGLLTGAITRQEVPLSIGITAQNAADVNRREKFLIYGSVFLVGRGPNVGRRRGELYCAPVLYWPARIAQE
ncbi:MAG: hypothetical protein KGO05_14940, partial [Chloroflexota bacterium]|nr:hypothetical protein [Chloroflexota bacterium]